MAKEYTQITKNYVGDPYVFPDTSKLKADGRVFKGWNTSADGSGIDITETSLVSPLYKNIYAKWLVPPKPVGGRIFYIHNDNGATYTFYDANGNVLTNQTVAGLANAVTYTVSGNPSADKFYVYDNSDTSPKSGLTWATTNATTNITANSIGSGKTNTATAMNTDSTKGEGTIFNWATSLTVGDCNDWYVGSMAEYDRLRVSGLVVWFYGYLILSSVETSSDDAFYWVNYSNNWNVDSKTYSYYCGIALRSF